MDQEIEDLREPDYVPELGDLVDFHGVGDYGTTSGQGEVIKIFKNGKIIVTSNDSKIKTTNYALLSRNG